MGKSSANDFGKEPKKTFGAETAGARQQLDSKVWHAKSYCGSSVVGRCLTLLVSDPTLVLRNLCTFQLPRAHHDICSSPSLFSSLAGAIYSAPHSVHLQRTLFTTFFSCISFLFAAGPGNNRNISRSIQRVKKSHRCVEEKVGQAVRSVRGRAHRELGGHGCGGAPTLSTWCGKSSEAISSGSCTRGLAIEPWLDISESDGNIESYAKRREFKMGRRFPVVRWATGVSGVPWAQARRKLREVAGCDAEADATLMPEVGHRA